MFRYKDQSPNNELVPQTSDQGFLGVNTVLDPGLLRSGAINTPVNLELAMPGMVADAENCRFRAGRAETRPGVMRPVWANPVRPEGSGFGNGLPIFQSVFGAEDEVWHEGVFGDVVLGFVPLSGAPNVWLGLGAGQVFWNDSSGRWQRQFFRAYVYKATSGGLPGVQRWCISFSLAADVGLPDGQFVPPTTFGAARWQSVETDGALPASPFDATWEAKSGSNPVPPGDAPVFTEKVGGRAWLNVRVVATAGWNPPRLPLLGTGVFSDPRGEEWVLAATARGVWQLREGHWWQEVPLPEGVELDGEVELIQTFAGVVMLRGPERAPLAWDGERGSGFRRIEKTNPQNPGDYTSPIPNAQTGAVMGNRLFLVAGRDEVAVSDVLDFTRYDRVTSTFRINDGRDEPIVAIQPHRRFNLLVFRETSIHALKDVRGNLEGVSLELINGEVGCIARRSIAMVGGDVMFLGANGVYRVSEVVEESMQVGVVPISERVQGYIDRINWKAGHKACAVAIGDTYRLALPLDGAEEPNAVLVYDTVRSEWQGLDRYDEGAEVRVRSFVVATVGGRKRAIAADWAGPSLLVLDAGGPEDVMARRDAAGGGNVFFSPRAGEPQAIKTRVRTRGYMLSENEGWKRFRHGFVTVGTWAPLYSIRTVAEGVDEVDVVREGRERSRTKSTRHAVAEWDRSNEGDDHGARGREDYSVVLEEPMALGSGVRLNLEQEAQEHFPIRRQAAWLALEVECAAGRVSMRSAGVDGSPRRNTRKVMT